MNQTDPNKKSKLVVIISLLKFLFPWAELIKMNLILSRINKFYPNKFFIDQKKKNTVVILITFLLTFIPGLLGYIARLGNKPFFYRIDKISELYENRKFSMILPAIKWAFSEKLFVFELKMTLFSVIGGILLSNILVYLGHRLVYETKKFRKILIKEGTIKEEDNSVVLFTPIGAFLDISGSSPKEIQSNQRIWLAMNIEVKEFSENPTKLSEVFFKSAFKLKSGYNYGIIKK